jgi:gluconokinase
MEKLAIGVDVGTTQAKAVAFQANGTVVASSYVRYPLIQEEWRSKTQKRCSKLW